VNTFPEKRGRPPILVPVLERICTELDLGLVGVPAAGGPPDFQGRYIVPARQVDAGLLPARFPASGDGRSPWATLAVLYPDRFGGLGEEEYADLVARRPTRRYFVGRTLRIPLDGQIVYAFTVETDESRDPGELPTPEEAGAVSAALEAAFALRPLAYFPDSRAARAWTDPGFPVLIIEPPVPYRRGDVDAGGTVGMTDVLVLLDHLFLEAGPIPCRKAADANDDGEVDLSDVVKVLFHLFGGGGELPLPSPACGLDPTEDGLSCGEFAPCGPASP
jgi:hypothetical protein